MDAKSAADRGRAVSGAWADIFDMPEAQKLYDAYLTPGPVTHTRTEVRDAAALAEFRNARETKAAVTGIVNRLKGELATAHPAFGRTHTLGAAGLGASVPIAWSDLATTPGFVAGGLSGVELADGTFVPDSRRITGSYSLVRTTLRGKPKVTLDVRGLTLTVHDSIDFCPGNLGSGMIRDVSLGLSRLERTPYHDMRQCGTGTKCFYARPALFEAAVPLNPVSVDVTAALSPHGKASTPR